MRRAIDPGRAEGAVTLDISISMMPGLTVALLRRTHLKKEKKKKEKFTGNGEKVGAERWSLTQSW